ncbi:HNH endonuclease [Vibrio fluvialis]
MDFLTLFEEELSKPGTKYFIFDTKGVSGEHQDADFIKYAWQTNKFNKVSPGDLFIYRRPGKASETGKFYFFGAGKVERIDVLDETETLVQASISKSYPFKDNLNPADLEHYEWYFKQRKPGTWEHFFNQYGMNDVHKEDFLNLLALSDGDIQFDYDNEAATDALQHIQTGNYHAEDEKVEGKRRSKQQVFSNQVKSNYGNCCAICGIKTRAFLVGSHIIPWSVRKDIRLDPSNGIALCTLHDKLFDQGYITLDKGLKVVVSDKANGDQALKVFTDLINGAKLRKPKKFPPKNEYLEFHRTEIFGN